MTRRSRLSKNYLNRSRQNLVLSVLGILVILFILIRYGIPFLSDTGFFLGQFGKESQTQKTINKESDFVSSPLLNPLPTTTKDQNIKVTGNAIPGLKVELYLNGSKEDEVEADSNGVFEFNIELSEGENILKARAISDNSKSDFSESLVITYRKKEPNLTIESPHDGDSITGGNQINVSGKTDSDNSVTVNDFLAIIDHSGSWSYNLTLVNGGNEIKVVAQDQAGNRIEKTIHVNYSP